MKRTSHGACSAFRGRLYLLTRTHTHSSLRSANIILRRTSPQLRECLDISEITIVSFFSTQHFVFSPHTNCPWLNKPARKHSPEFAENSLPKRRHVLIFFNTPPLHYFAGEFYASEVAAYERSAAGGGKVHIPALPAEQVGLICCYGNSCYKERFVPEGQAHFLWH